MDQPSAVDTPKASVLIPEKKGILNKFLNRRFLLFSSLITLILIITILLNYLGIITLKTYSPLFSFLPTKIPILAQVGNKLITSEDLKEQFRLTRGYYAQTDIAKPDINQNIFNELLEQEIIKQEAIKLGITVSNSEIDTQQNILIQQAGGQDKYTNIIKGNNWSLDDQRNKITFTILKDKLAVKVTSWRVIDGISAYLDPLEKSYPSKKEVVTTTLLKAGNSLSKQASVSAATTEAAKGQTVIKNFGKVEGKRVKKKDDLDKKILEGVFKTNKGQISPVLISESGGSFWIVRIIDSNDTSYSNYQEWLEIKMKEYVKKYI